MLYNNALRDYNGGKNDLATQEFNDYIKFYPNTDLAGNSYFYLAEIQFKAGDYQEGGRRTTIWFCRIFRAGTKPPPRS